jgi:HK97 family phage prohead protease
MNGRLEIREREPGGPIELKGYGATFDQGYDVAGSFTETIRPGAFRRTLGESPDVCLLQNHDGAPLARTTAGTMELSEDGTGLRFSAELEPTDPDVQALVPKIRRGDMSECSFAFRATRQEWSKDKSERTLLEVGIHKGDISIVNHAANPNATASVRAGNLTLEQRERMAKRVGNDVRGPSFTFDASSSGRSRIAEPKPEPRHRSYVEEAKRKRAQLRRGRDDGAPTRPSDTGRSSRARAALALSASRAASRRALGDLLLSPHGPDWEMGSVADIHKAVIAVEIGRAHGGKEDAIKAWIHKRATDMGVPEMVPADWKGDWQGSGNLLGQTSVVAGKKGK